MLIFLLQTTASETAWLATDACHSTRFILRVGMGWGVQRSPLNGQKIPALDLKTFQDKEFNKQLNLVNHSSSVPCHLYCAHT